MTNRGADNEKMTANLLIFNVFLSDKKFFIFNWLAMRNLYPPED